MKLNYIKLYYIGVLLLLFLIFITENVWEEREAGSAGEWLLPNPVALFWCQRTDGITHFPIPFIGPTFIFLSSRTEVSTKEN